jgi:hypothetical protein
MHVALHMSVFEEGFRTLAIQIHVRTKEEQEIKFCYLKEEHQA